MIQKELVKVNAKNVKSLINKNNAKWLDFLKLVAKNVRKSVLLKQKIKLRGFIIHSNC